MRVLTLVLLLSISACRTDGEPRPPEAKTADTSHEPAEADALEVPAPGSGEPQNPLQVEMRGLTSLMHLTIVAVANDQLSLIPPAISQLHGAIEETQSALKEGRFRLPRNADDVEGFLAADDAFHDELVVLLRAARANDLPAVSRQVGVLMEGCTTCHSRYRFDPR